MSLSSLPLTADDIVKVLEGASRTGVLSLAYGPLSFTREGFVAPPVPLSPEQFRVQAAAELREGPEAAEEWSGQAVPKLDV